LPAFEDAPSDVDVQMRRQQHMDDVAVRAQQLGDVAVHQRHVECGGGLGRALTRDVADRPDLDAVGRLQRLRMGCRMYPAPSRPTLMRRPLAAWIPPSMSLLTFARLFTCIR
jgi:hypothetical protein